MKPIIAFFLTPLVYATCDYPSGIGTWQPKPGQTFGLVMGELGITAQVIEALNPSTDIDDIYPEISYNVTIKPPRSGEWIDGCPPSLMVKSTEDTTPIDSAIGQPETTSVDEYERRSTRTISTTVDTATTTTTIHGVAPPSPSTLTDTRSTDTPYQLYPDRKESDARSKELPSTGPSIDGTSSPASKPTVPSLSESGGYRLSDIKNSDVSTASEATHSVDLPESPTTVAENSEVNPSSTRRNIFASSAATHNEVTGESTLTGPTATTVLVETTYSQSADEKGRATATEVSTTVPSSITDATKVGTVLSSTASTACTLPQTDYSHDTKTEKLGGSSLAEEQPVSSEDFSAREPSGGASTGPTTTLTTDGTITTSTVSQSQVSDSSTRVLKDATSAEDASTKIESTNTEAASDQTTASTHTTPTKPTTTQADISSYTTSTDQRSKETESTSTKVETTLVTSPSKAASETTSTGNPYSREAVRLATCLYDPNLIGLGQTNGGTVSSVVDDVCDFPSFNGLMKAGDKCIKIEKKDGSKINYVFEICPKEDCPGGGQSMKQPFGKDGLSCKYIFFQKIWRWCNEINHHGNGGYFDAGCLTYNLEIG
ncbi:hypothetical protein FSARC_13093 [Fusarium sarcochroum]|uniref:LysM domain-containing protein n=1 Tax=Fusarium sarcochroum TaxID=1208366 RepID=A0A8H4T3T8_9HYPO|nr:hypothetical protein FSARC_13093 [Fusarium sarcochroum]